MMVYTSNIRLPELDAFYRINCKTEQFERTASGKSWRSKPMEVRNEIISAQTYWNFCDSIPFFKGFGNGASERAEFSHTPAGYLVTRITSIAPGRETKIVRSFKIEYVGPKGGDNHES